MGTTVSVNTYTHSVSYVTDKMLTSLKYIISQTGLDVNKFVSDWSTYELAVSTWLHSKHLSTVVLEVFSNGNLVTRSDMDINYSYGDGDGSMWIDKDALRFAISKFGTFPSLCDYNIKLIVKYGHPEVDGWGEGSLMSTTGFVKQSLGTTIGTHAIGAQASYWRKL